MLLKVILVTAGVLLASVAVVAFLGSRLPVSHVASRSMLLPVPPERVFAVVTDFAAAPSWRTGLSAVELVPVTGGERLRFTEVSGSDRLTFEVELIEPARRLVTRIVGDGLPFGGRWVYELAPAPGGSRLTITEYGEVFHPIFRFVSARIIGHTATLDRYLGDLARALGGTAPVEHGVVPGDSVGRVRKT